MKTIYLDNNATSRVAPEVMEAMVPYLGEFYGNPSSMHSFGGQVAAQLREAREQVADAARGRSGGDHLHELRHGKRQHGDPVGPRGAVRGSGASSRAGWSTRRSRRSVSGWGSRDTRWSRSPSITRATSIWTSTGRALPPIRPW